MEMMIVWNTKNRRGHHIIIYKDCDPAMSKRFMYQNHMGGVYETNFNANDINSLMFEATEGIQLRLGNIWLVLLTFTIPFQSKTINFSDKLVVDVGNMCRLGQ